jgi:hypothetical protein
MINYRIKKEILACLTDSRVLQVLNSSRVIIGLACSSVVVSAAATLPHLLYLGLSCPRSAHGSLWILTATIHASLILLIVNCSERFRLA